MRRVTTLKLNNGDNISIVADVTSGQDARRQAIANWSRLLQEKSMEITKSTPIVSVEDWDKERNATSKSAPKMYFTSFFFEGIAQYVEIEAHSIKSAYLNVRNKFGIQENLFMFIYEKEQDKERKSALEESKKALSNKEVLYHVLKETLLKIKTSTPDRYNGGIKIIVNIIKDSMSGKTNICSQKTIWIAVGCLIYYNNPFEYIMDLNNITETMTEMQIKAFLVCNMINEIGQYRQIEETKLKNEKSKR